MGDEFDQYRRQAQVGADHQDDEYAQYVRQNAHGKFPSFPVTADTQHALEHTAPGTDTDLASRGRQIIDVGNPWTRPIISGKTLMEGFDTITPHFGDKRSFEERYRDMGVSHPTTLSPGANAAKVGMEGAAKDIYDLAGSFTSPLSIGTLGLGGLAKAAPAAGKLLQIGGGLGFGFKGAKDIYDVTAGEEKDRPLDERLQKGLMAGATMASAGAGVGESSLRGSLNKGMDVRAANEPFTPRDLYDTAEQHGISLDLADATGRPLLRGMKAGSMHGLAGSGPFERNQAHNIEALLQWTEDAGNRVQAALENDYAARKQGASQIFEDLDKRVGPNFVNGKATVQAQAMNIRNQFQGYYDLHPEVLPRKAWAVVKDLSEKGNYSWSELHNMRSDLMDIYRNNPEMIKSREQAWLQQLVKSIDDTMTGNSTVLPPADQAKFRQANATWEQLKETYDNPRHPLYTAIRSTNPSEVPKYLNSKKAPEFQRSLHPILGPAYDELVKLGKIGEKVMKDYNPSGTAKVGQKFAQVSGISSGVPLAAMGHPVPLALTAADLAGEYGVAKAFNSPRVTRFLTDRNRAPAMPRGLGMAGVTASDEDNEGVRRAEELLDRINNRRRVIDMAPPR